MPFYNCYDGTCSSKYTLSSTLGPIDIPTTKYKSLLVPIKFNKTYTIAVENSTKIICVPAFIENGNLIEISGSSLSTRLYTELDCIKTLPFSSFSKPFTYELNIASIASDSLKSRFKRYEKNLVLMIQVLADNDSTVTVLEGDYTDTSTYHVFNVSQLLKISPIVKDKLLLSSLSLLNANDHSSYAFSDRLIEYLLNNVIDKNCEIQNNIRRVQEDSEYELYAPTYYEDIWDDYFRYYLYNLYLGSEQNENTLDINGYVDKDLEKFTRDLKYNGGTYGGFNV